VTTFVNISKELALQVASRVWCDEEMKHFVFAEDLTQAIAFLLSSYIYEKVEDLGE